MVAKAVWVEVKRILKQDNLDVSYQNIATMWLSEKKFTIHNTVYAAALWVLWNTRNDIYFNRSPWLGMQKLWRMTARMMSQWSVLFSGDIKGNVELVAKELELLARAPPLLLWPVSLCVLGP